MPPDSDDSTHSAPEPAQASAAAGRAVILVVEDDDLVRAFILRVLEREGYALASAPNGVDGLRQCREVAPALVITDIVMPDMEGLEMIRELRKVDPSLPVLAISGGGRGDPRMYLDMARHLGARATLAKPFDREALLGAVASLLGR
jgi:CheY-like chemotaxis protein